MCDLLIFDKQIVAIFAVIILGYLVICGFFGTKKDGYGSFNTSTLILIVVLILSALLAIIGAIKQEAIVNIMIGVVGFAGGLFANKNANTKQQTKENDNTQTEKSNNSQSSIPFICGNKNDK